MAFKPKHCSNSDCPFHLNTGGLFTKKSFYKIKRINQWIRRYQCRSCKKTLSSRSFKSDYGHKKMDLNRPLERLLVEGNSLRGCSRLLGLTYKNTYNKFLWRTKQASLKKRQLKPQAQTLYFDEMESIHHTKCKPLSIAIMVNEQYQILDLQVAEMPAKGRLAEFSIRKYGWRKDERELVMKKMFMSLKKNSPNLQPLKIISDAKPSYAKFVAEFFSHSVYETYSRAKKERERQQSRIHEKLQKRKYDPMFTLNQRCAKLRSDIKRLARRSWCTTKKPANLQGHLDLYIVNQVFS
jgi:transposase-like protein